MTLAIKWNKIEMVSRILYELRNFGIADRFINNLDQVNKVFELILTLNRPEIFQLFLNEYPNIIDIYLNPKTLYFLYNFKNEVILLKIFFLFILLRN